MFYDFWLRFVLCATPQMLLVPYPRPPFHQHPLTALTFDFWDPFGPRPLQQPTLCNACPRAQLEIYESSVAKLASCKLQVGSFMGRFESHLLKCMHKSAG